jgi:hypothetical protein
VDGNEEDEGRIPVIEYDRDNPSIKEGSIFPSMTDCRNALATYCIKSEFDFVIDKSESSRLTMHCAYQCSVGIGDKGLMHWSNGTPKEYTREV